MSNNFPLFLIKYFKNIISTSFLNSLIVKASKSKGDKLEITLTIGCAMMCEYCPQTLIRNVSSKRNIKRKMEFEDFKEFISNVLKQPKFYGLDIRNHWLMKNLINMFFI